VVGLGNPGPAYELTRHNVGQMAVAACADSAGQSFQKFKSHGVLATVSHPAGFTLRLAALSSFMNRSGGPVQAMLAFHKIPPAQLVVIHDDLDLPHGIVRLKFGGGHAGHNGLKDIAQALGTLDFHRVRVGIGRPDNPRPVADYVLQRFDAEQSSQLPAVLRIACDAVQALVGEGLTAAQQKIHPPQSS
jgi:peptidyl-tRNA hydrolase, PTH1 family